MVLKKPSIPVLNTLDGNYAQLLLAHPFVDGVGPTVTDLSGNGYHATATGSFTWINDAELGVVMQLDGVSAYVNLAAGINAILGAQSTATVAFWLKLKLATPTNANKTGLIDLKQITGANSATKYPAGGSVAGETNGLGYFSVFRQTSRVNGVNLGATDRATWHHLAITTQSGGNYRVYVNGVEVTSGVAAEFNVSTTVPPTIGRSTDGVAGPYYMDGYLGDFRAWTRVLLAPEILTLFNDPWRLYIPATQHAQAKEFGVNVDLGREYLATAKEFGTNADLMKDHPADASMLMLQGDIAFDRQGADMDFMMLQADLVPGAVLASKPEGMDAALKPIIPTRHDPPDSILTNLLLAIPFTEGVGTNAADKAGAVGGPYDATLVAPATWASTANFKRRDFSNNPSLNPAATGFATIPRDAVFEPTSTEFTIAAWVRPTGNQADRAIFSKLGLTGQTYYLGTNSAGTGWRFAVTDVVDGTGNCDGGAIGSALIHVVGSYKSLGAGAFLQQLYINGVLTATRGNSGDLSVDTTKLERIGRGEGLANSFSGEIEDVRYWDRCLTDAEVLALFNAPFGLYCDFAWARHYLTTVDLGRDYSATSRSFGVTADISLENDAGADLMMLQADLGWDRQGADMDLFMLQADLEVPITNIAGMAMFNISPNFGPKEGGTFVTITGINFRDITQVLVGGVPLTGLTVIGSNTITGTTGAHVAGLVDIQIISSTAGTITILLAYAYTGGYGPGSGALKRGKQFHPQVFRQEYFNGQSAPIGVDTVLALTLADFPLAPESLELYIQRPGDQGGLLQRQGVGFNYTVDMANKKIIWKATAPQAINPADVLAVWYFAQVQ